MSRLQLRGALAMSVLNQAATLFKVIQTIAGEIDQDLPLTYVLVFARVARAGAEGIDQGKVQDELKLNSSTISRTAQGLGDIHYQKAKPGLGLVERQMNLTDNHKRTLRLTPKGERLMVKVAGALK
jgi:DNA-binding MarR family transcriptional regulator